MGSYEREFWLSDTWGRNREERQSGTFCPYVPDMLAGQAIALGEQAAAAAAQAQADVALLDGLGLHLRNTESLARLLFRAEAMSSSRIEGLVVPAGKLLEREALDELGVAGRVDSVEAAVLANVAAMQQGIESIAQGGALSVERICGMNAALLANTNLAGQGGRLRTVQNWIGGNAVNPIGAAYVPPRPERVPALMDDLVRFLDESALPPVAVAALAHAQLETIHPFVDGNGRTGRALIHVVLRRAGVFTAVVPPVSLVLASDKKRYIANLTAYRTDAEGVSGAEQERMRSEAIDGWVEYFARSLSEACARAQAFEGTLASIERGWRERCKVRRGSAADQLLSRLVDNPVVSIQSAMRLCGKSREAARNALLALTREGVLVQNARNRKSNIYVATEVVDAFTRYERSLATPGGETSIEKPARPVPQRVK